MNATEKFKLKLSSIDSLFLDFRNPLFSEFSTLEVHKFTYISLFVLYRQNKMELERRPSNWRKASRLDVLTKNLKLDVRAHQRTYEGAYTRTAIGCLSFSIVIIKLFSKEFLPIGTIYTAYGCLLYFIGVIKSASIEMYYEPDEEMTMYRTSGDSVLLLTIISLLSYITILVLVLRL